MKSKITKIQILKNGVVILLAMMFMLTPIAYAATSLDDSTTPSGSNGTTNNNVGSTIENNTVVENTVTGNNTIGNTATESGSTEGGSSSGGLSWKEIFYGKVGAAADDIKKKLDAGETKIEISDEIQLRAIAELVNNGKNDFKGITVLLTNNIVIESDEEWTPIGTEEVPFQGRFLGCEVDDQGNPVDKTKGKKISNLEYLKTGKTYEELTNVGLFGVIGSEAQVYNILLDNFNINIFYDASDIVANKNSTAGTKNTYYYNVGNMAGINEGTIKNCYVVSDIKGGSQVGGFVGTNNGTIMNCTNYGVTMGYDIVGGIAGYNKGRIEQCKNIGDVKGAEQDIGGIAGILDSGDINLSHNKGNVQGNISSDEETRVGGIAGASASNSGSIKYCMYEGKTTYKGDQKSVYGILGNWNNDNAGVVYGCIAKDPNFSADGDDNQVGFLNQDSTNNWEYNWGESLLNPALDNLSTKGKCGFVVKDPISYSDYTNGWKNVVGTAYTWRTSWYD